MGYNQGRLGLHFGAESNRGELGCQQADNLVVTAPRSLTALPIQSNFSTR